NLDQPTQTNFVSTIHKESLRLTSLLDEILDLSALERGERNWETQNFDAEAALDQALRVCEALALQSGTKLLIGERAKRAIVAGDADRLSQVLINLISNAIKYNVAEAPSVSVTTMISKRNYIVIVEDNGPGIPEDEHLRIFDKFYRGRTGGFSSGSGAGLGLPISREIIHRMQGSLELIEGATTGACFRVRLPLQSSF